VNETVEVKMLVHLAPQKFNTFNTFNTFDPVVSWHGIEQSASPSLYHPSPNGCKVTRISFDEVVFGRGQRSLACPTGGLTMRHVRALLALVFACTLVFSGFPSGAASRVAAQDEGVAVPIADEEGTAVGSITVNEVVDPFTDFDPAYPPEEGSRYVAVNIAFDADAGNRFEIAPYTIVLQDDAGFLWTQASLPLAEDALVPELSGQTLGPGSRVTGVVGFQIPEGSEPALVLYQPESSRIVPLLNLGGEEPPALGETVAIVDSEGGTGSVTVSEVADPFEDVDPSQTPPEDGRFVMVTLVFENTSEGRFFVEPYGLLLRDENGNLWSATSVTRLEESELIPDMTSAQLAPGDRLSGAVVFVVPEGVGLAGIYTSPGSSQLLQLADLESGSDLEAGTAPDATNDESEATPAVSTAGDCADLEQWLASARERIQRAGEMSLEDASLEDLDALAEHVDEYAALAEAQLADQAPPEAEAAAKALAATFQAYSDAVDQILSANDPGKDVTVELTEGMNTFNDAGSRLNDIEAELNRIAADCGLT